MTVWEGLRMQGRGERGVVINCTQKRKGGRKAHSQLSRNSQVDRYRKNNFKAKLSRNFLIIAMLLDMAITIYKQRSVVASRKLQI
jgi:hypothetical protein